MSTSTRNHTPASGAHAPVFADIVGRAMASVAVVVGVVLYLVVGPLIALGTGFAGFIAEIRDGITRPRPFFGTPHGFPFLDRSATAVSDDANLDPSQPDDNPGT